MTNFRGMGTSRFGNDHRTPDHADRPWKTQREYRVIIWSTTLALALLPVQIVLGGSTDTALLELVIVTAHLGVAILILLSLTTATVTAWTQALNR